MTGLIPVRFNFNRVSALLFAKSDVFIGLLEIPEQRVEHQGAFAVQDAACVILIYLDLRSAQYCICTRGAMHSIPTFPARAFSPVGAL
jgi:hypothetical protein